MKFNWKFLLFSILGTVFRIIPAAIVPEEVLDPLDQSISSSHLHEDLKAYPLLAFLREYRRQ
jgi:hypothetical protein